MITNFDLSNENFPPNSAAVVKIKSQKGDEFTVRVLRVSFVGELGYELHIPKESCDGVYKILMKAGESFNLKNAGYRSVYSLSSEKGNFWGIPLTKIKLDKILARKIFSSLLIKNLF